MTVSPTARPGRGMGCADVPRPPSLTNRLSPLSVALIIGALSLLLRRARLLFAPVLSSNMTERGDGFICSLLLLVVVMMVLLMLTMVMVCWRWWW